MPTPWERVENAKDTLKGLQHRPAAALRSRASSDESDDTIYVRTRPKAVELSETYHYYREISRNSSTRPVDQPIGCIEHIIPYDGYEYVTRQAASDVRNQIGSRVTNVKVDALGGHLILNNYERTNINELLNLSYRYRSVPIKLPVTSENDDYLSLLCGDKFDCVTQFNYLPQWPDVTPVQVQMELVDEDSLSAPSIENMTNEGRKQIDNVVEQIAQQVNFRRSLLLSCRVSFFLPGTSNRTRSTENQTNFPGLAQHHIFSFSSSDGRRQGYTNKV